MAKLAPAYVCQSCGALHSRWSGKCGDCGAWNSLSEESAAPPVPGQKGKPGRARALDLVPLAGENDAAPLQRLITGINEFDRVTGGGLVPGSALLVGGDPGIGKSTLLLQAVCALANRGQRCLYVSGEESVEQVRLRARRLGLEKAPVELASDTDAGAIVAALTSSENRPALVIIDSIQTMAHESVESAPGTVTQVRACAQILIQAAKKRGAAILFVGHVTKDGQIAGPRVLEHMVDAVLYVEGDRSHHFRILRGVKNRFGPTDEIGVFEMGTLGLSEVANPSAFFLAQRQQNVPGSAVLAAIEGTRPMLLEVQALIAPSSLSQPRRAVIGWDSGRLAMVLAVLESRLGLSFSGCDVFLNIAGGARIAEPAADLAVAAALVSALQGDALPAETVFFGEIGLAGEIRAVAQPDQRLKEAEKLGFTAAVMPRRTAGKSGDSSGLTQHECGHLSDVLEQLGLT